MRHPGRHFPGVLVQGDTLHAMCVRLDAVCKEARGRLSEDALFELNEHRNHLWDLLNHYKAVLLEHQIPLPFAESLMSNYTQERSVNHRGAQVLRTNSGGRPLSEALDLSE
jgi:hypothetical protein